MPEATTTAEDPARRSPAATPTMPPRVGIGGSLRILAAIWSADPLLEYLGRGPAIRTLRVPGLGDVVAVWDPADVRKLYTSSPDAIPAGVVHHRLLGGLGSHSVMVLDGEPHMRMRKLLLPPFHGEAIQRYVELIEQVTAEQIERWPRGAEFETQSTMYRILLEVLLRAVVGVRDERRANRLRALLPNVLEANALAFIAEGRFPRLGRGALARVQPWMRNRREVLMLLREEIADHRASPEGRDDVLATLIEARDPEGESLTDDELQDQMMTLLVAGHQTTGSTLAWCFERLTRHPDVLARLTREVREGGDDYLEAVVKETERVRPAVEVTWRLLNEPTELSGHLVPAGTVVMPMMRMVQLSDAWEDAERFRPERFLAGKPRPYTWIPFGGGSRRCLGAAFAHLEMKAILRTVLLRYDLETTDRAPERRNRFRIFTTLAGRGARVTVRDRPRAPTPELAAPASAA